jgi:beta-glucanase (GH16 family)
MTASTHPQATVQAVAILRSRARVLIAIVAAAILGGAWVVMATDARAALPTPAGWTQVFGDDFTGGAGSRVSGNWRYTTGTSYPGGPANFGTGEVETMTDSTSNVSLDGAGNLKITALRGGPTGWTSGRIETNRDDFQPPAGGKLRVEARMRLPDVSGNGARGYWPAFWMLGAPYRGNYWNWPGVGEIDIMENVQGLNREWGTMHCGSSPGGPCNEKSGIGNNVPCNGATCQGGFHTYAIEWDRSTNPQQVRWYLDGVQFHTVSANQMPADVWNAATGHGFFVILNLAMGGEFPAALGGGPDGATASGGSLLVDYVGVWTAGAGGPPPGQTTGPPVSPPPTCGPLISQGRPTSSSAIEAPNLAAQYAVDGNPGTRWSSAFSDPQWMQIDLGAAKPITRVRLNWETAYATAYQIQTSTNGSSWSTAYSTASGDGGIDDLNVAATARYVRMYGTQRATPYGYSLWEFEVYGACGPGSPPASTPPNSPPASSPPNSPPPPGTYPAWAPNTAYAVGARVSYAGLNYQCLQAHTSIVTWEPPNTPALWQRL